MSCCDFGVPSVVFPTPLGDVVAVFSPRGLCVLAFADSPRLAAHVRAVRRHVQVLLAQSGVAQGWVFEQQVAQVVDAVGRFFAGRLPQCAVPLDLVGTPFQCRVWQSIQRIPPGATWTYAQLAAWVGQPSAVRAVAHANAHNKLMLLVPCHRVLGQGQRLTGYAGGLARKQWLLDWERAQFAGAAVQDGVDGG